jgi:transcription initiation factor IIF auxiliary subunit
MFVSGQAMAQSLDVQNVAERAGDQWKWTAFVTGPPEQIAKIRCVRYTLHPTFPDPVKEVCEMSDPKHPFAFSAVGWGTFNLRARIEFKDGSSSDLTHYLKF